MLTMRNLQRPLADRRFAGALGSAVSDLPELANLATASTAIPPAIRFDRVSFAFDEQVVLRDVSFAVPVGSMKILLGASGVGKSVVLKLIRGLLRPDAGRRVRATASPSRGRLQRNQACCCSTTRLQASIPLLPRRSTMKSSSFATWSRSPLSS
jgi:ABC-type phosphate/phosphonate transport system ATPase subunit